MKAKTICAVLQKAGHEAFIIKFHQWQECFTEEIYSALGVESLGNRIKAIHKMTGDVFQIIYLKKEKENGSSKEEKDESGS